MSKFWGLVFFFYVIEASLLLFCKQQPSENRRIGLLTSYMLSAAVNVQSIGA